MKSENWEVKQPSESSSSCPKSFSNNTSTSMDCPRDIHMVPNHNTWSHQSRVSFQLRASYLYNLAMHYKGNRRQQLNTLLQEKRIKPRHVPLILHDKKSAQHMLQMFLFISWQTTCYQTPHRNTWKWDNNLDNAQLSGHLHLQKSLKTAIPGVPQCFMSALLTMIFSSCEQF